MPKNQEDFHAGPSQGRRVWLRWSLVALLLVGFLALGGGAEWLVRRARQAARQKAAVARVRALGGRVYYDYQHRREGDMERLTGVEDRPAPAWVYSWLGRDFLHWVFYVDFAEFRRGDRESRVPVLRRDVTDAELVWLKDLPRLRWLSLNGTGVTDSGLEYLARFARLERLWLSGTAVGDRGMRALRQMPVLRQLYLNGTRVTDAGLAELAGLQHLERLVLAGPAITDAGLAHLEHLRHLELLFLDGTRVTDAGMDYLGRLKGLQLLRLSRCNRITDAGTRPLGRLVGLRELDLSDCQNLTDAALEPLGALAQIQALSLRGTGVTDTGLRHLDRLTQLRTLLVDRTRCTLSGVVRLFVDGQGRRVEEALRAVARTQADEAGNLISLDLTGVRVSDDCLVHLRGCSRLQWLLLQGREVTDTGLRHLAGLKDLCLLNLAETRVTDAGLDQLEGLAGLRTLHLGGTGVSEAAVRRFVQQTGGRVRVYLVDYSRLGHVALPGATRGLGPAPTPNVPGE